MTEDNFSTELSSGEDVPVRRVGSMFIVGYDHIPADEFMTYVDLLLSDEGQINEYDESDVEWVTGAVIDFGDEDGVPKLKLHAATAHLGIDATVLECW